MYFPDTAVLERAEEGDLLLLALLRDRSVVAVIARGGSSYERQLLWLFGIDGGRADGFTVRADLADQRRDIDITARFLLDLLGVPDPLSFGTHLDRLIRKFGGRFPGTAEFSKFARDTLPEVTELDDPDAVPVAWMEREEILFRTLERHLVATRLPEVSHPETGLSLPGNQAVP